MTVRDYNWGNNWNRTSRDITQHKIICLSWYEHNLSICSQHEKEKIDMWLLEGLSVSMLHHRTSHLQGCYLHVPFSYSQFSQYTIMEFQFNFISSCSILSRFFEFKSDDKLQVIWIRWKISSYQFNITFVKFSGSLPNFWGRPKSVWKSCALNSIQFQFVWTLIFSKGF